MKLLSYTDAIKIIEDGDVILFHPTPSWSNPISLLIMKGTGSPFSHTNIAFWMTISGVKHLMAVEAQGGTERRIVNMSFYSNMQFTVLKGLKPWPTISNDCISGVAEQKYSYLTAVYAGLRDYCIRNFRLKLPKFAHPGEICSEFVAREQGLEDTDISPGTLYNTLITMTVEKG